MSEFGPSLKHICKKCGDEKMLPRYRTWEPLCIKCGNYTWLLVGQQCPCCGHMIQVKNKE